MWHIGEGWGWWMAMGWVWMIVFWGLILYGLSALVTRSGNDASPPRSAEPTAREILERRYARGELLHPEFEAMGERLDRSRVAGAGGDLTPAPTARS